MEIKIEPRDDVTIATLTGKLDGISAPDAFDKLSPLITASCRLVLAMNECHYVSSAGLRTILMLGKKIKSVNGRGVMYGLQDDVKEVMEMTGFSDIFKNYDTLDAAIAALKEN